MFAAVVYYLMDFQGPITIVHSIQTEKIVAARYYWYYEIKWYKAGMAFGDILSIPTSYENLSTGFKDGKV
jgi:hypothetical protein